MVSRSYLLGHKYAIKKIMRGANLLLPNSRSEYDRLVADTGISKEYHIVPNGVDSRIFGKDIPGIQREKKVICVAQIYGRKNQHMLIHACRELGYPLEIIGKPPPNHMSYYKYCRQIADESVDFIDHVPQEDLVKHYASAEVHALPSWFETTGLTSLEAAALGCKLVVGTGGDTFDYFGAHAWYCNPSRPESIKEALKNAMESPADDSLRNKILEEYTWDMAAHETHVAYKKVLDGKT
jgi:glycosyltransferase involved in cell wall biosynthesis